MSEKGRRGMLIEYHGDPTKLSPTALIEIARINNIKKSDPRYGETMLDFAINVLRGVPCMGNKPKQEKKQ